MLLHFFMVSFYPVLPVVGAVDGFAVGVCDGPGIDVGKTKQHRQNDYE